MATKLNLRITSPHLASFSLWPYLEQDDISAAVEVLRSGEVNYWTGQEGRLFEKEFAEYIGCNYAVALANGTVALELALYALGVGPGDEVITTSRTFIASASAAVLRSATPVFADVDPISQNITAEAIEPVITPRTKAIVVVHLAGWPCDMDAIMTLAQRHGIKVVEDCAQALGATYKGRRVGSIGHVATFSFCQDKILTTAGEGGMLTTNDEALWKKAWSYKDHGKNYDAVYNGEHAPGSSFRWLHDSFGTNWRMIEVQAAIGRVGLRKLPKWLEIRRRHAEILTERFSMVPGLRVTSPPADVEHAYYKYYVFVRPDRLRYGWSRDGILNALNNEGVPCFTGSCSEVYLEKAFKETGFGPAERLPVAKELGETSLMFLVHPTLSEEALFYTAETTEKVMAEASLGKRAYF